MAWRYHGHARVDSTNPEGFGVCDRCNFLYNLNELVWQHYFRGPNLVNIWLRVCRRTCLDIPQSQVLPKILPPDPIPLYQPRPENYAAEDAGQISAAASAHPPTPGSPILDD